MSQQQSPQQAANRSNPTSPQSVVVVNDADDKVPNSRPATSDLPQELFQSGRSQAGLLGSSMNTAGTKRKKKKVAPPAPQAHPEPRGADEAEVRMLWNRIAPLRNANKMTTPNEPPLLYSNTGANFLAGGLQDQPSVASLTGQFTDTPRNLVALARGPLEVFVANGSHPKIGWLVPDNAVLGVQTQSEEGNRLQLVSSRPGTSGDDGNHDLDFGSGSARHGDNNNAIVPTHQPICLFPPSYNNNNNNTNNSNNASVMNTRNGATSPGAVSPININNNNNNTAIASGGSRVRSSSTNKRENVDVLSSSFNSYTGALNNNFGATNNNNNNNNAIELADLIATNNLQNYRRIIQQNVTAGNLAAPLNVKDDGDTILMEKHLDECAQWMTDLATAVQNEKHLFTQWKAELHQEIRALQLDQARKLADYDEDRTQSQAKQRAELYLKENDLEKLKSGREKVLDWLTEKKRILRELRETSVTVEDAERASTMKLLDVEQELRNQKGRLEDILKAKLANAVDQMAQLSEAQRKARESSTVEDFNRLVKELSEQERKMRELSTTSGKLQHRISALRREISLETQRGQMLQEKQEGYHGNISTLVHRLEEIERKYAAQSQRELKGLMVSAASPSSQHQQGQANQRDGDNNNNHDEDDDADDKNKKHGFAANAVSLKQTKQQLQLQLQQQQFTELPRIIDQQYAVILQLRADLVRVRQEVRQASVYLQQERTAVIQPANPSTQPILSRTAKKQQQQQQVNGEFLITPHPPGANNINDEFLSSQQPSLLSVVDSMRTNEMNFIKNIVFEALSDADKNLVNIVNNYNHNSEKTTSTSSLLPPIYPTLEVLDPVQRRDVFEFVVRRINTKLLNPLGNNNGAMMRKKIYNNNNDEDEEVGF